VKGPEPTRSGRQLTRLLVSLAVIVLGLAAAPRLPLAYEPVNLFPELEVSAGLPRDAATAATRDWLLAEIEKAIRKSGQVARTSGDVGEARVELRVRYQPGVTIDDKATLLDSLLGDLRRRLPAGSYLQVYSRSRRGGEFSFVVEVARADPALLDAVSRLPGVAAASFSGGRSPELRFELPPEKRASASEVAAALRPRRLGEVDRAHGATLLETRAPSLEDVPLGRTPLSRLGSFHSLPGEPALAARLMGHPAELLVVDRDPAASPLDLERDLRRALEDAGLAGGRFLRQESRSLRQLLFRFFLALAAGSLLLALLHFLFFSARAAAWQLLALPLGLAAALPPLYLAGASLDVLSLPALFLAVLLAPLPAALGRRGLPAWGRLFFAAAAIATLPIALALLGRLGIFLGPPARVFLIAFAAAACVQLLLPPPGQPRPRAARTARRLEAAARRRAGSLLLATAVLLYVSWVFFGDALWPRAGSLRQDLGDLSLALMLPPEASFESTEAEVLKVEKLLAARSDVASFFALYRRGAASFYLDLTADRKKRILLERSGNQIEHRLRTLGIATRAQPLGGAQNAPPLRFDRDDELQPEANFQLRIYRALLRGRDFETVVATANWLRARISRQGDGAEGGVDLVPDWRPPDPALLLRANPGTDSSAVSAAGAALAEVFGRDELARLPPLPGQKEPLLLRLVPPGLGEGRLREPRLEEALAALRRQDEDLGRHFTLAEISTAPELHWQSFSYVLPIDVEIRSTPAFWSWIQNDIHSTLERLPMPPGTDLELPLLDGEPFEDRLRMLGAFSLLPLLLLALLAMRLDSLWLAVAALLPALGAVFATAPVLRMHAAGLDEATLLALGATVAGLLPLAALAAGAGRGRRLAPAGTAPAEMPGLWAARGHRELCRALPHAVPALLAALFVLLLAGAGLAAERNPWVGPLRVAGVALLAGSLLALFVSPALQVAVEALLRWLRKDERARRRAVADPPAWRGEEEANLLEVRSLSKRYGNGFRALRRLDLKLEPGIVGLLGPNGAGKTTLLRTLCGTLSPSRGQVYFRGQAVLPENLPAYRRRVGYLPQSFNAWDGLSAERFLSYWADHLGLPTGEERKHEIGAALASVGLEEKAGHPVRELSGGQRRRLGIARALLGRPPILIVDEPTTGLDVEARNQLRQSLAPLAAERIVIFSTHIASDIAAVASRVLILDRGRLLFDGPPAELIESARGRVFERRLKEDELRPFSRQFHITTRIREPEGIRVRAVTHPGQQPEGELVLPNLEEAYLSRLGSQAKVRDESSWASLLDLDAWRSR
jgi:ABC-2 type transport system ATP-binding protein